MGEPAGERWAPFPVQDWSTLPQDPLDGGPAAPAPAPAAGGAAASHPPWWVPLVVLLSLGLLVGTGTWLARRAPEPRTAALAYVPADGVALWQRQDVTREADTRTTTVVTESARLSGVNSVLSSDPALTTRVLRPDLDDASGARLWRTTTTHVDEAGVGAQDVRYYRVRGAVELAGQQVGERITAYEPALVELPADVGPGSTWTGAGTVGGTQDYTSTFTAAAGQTGCLDVTGELVVRPSGTQQDGLRTTLTRTWCPGRGLVASSESGGASRTVLTAVDAPAPGPRTTASAPITWTDPRAWTPKTWDTVTVDPESEAVRPMNGSAQTLPPPVLTSSGVVVRAMSSPHDLVATTPKTPDAWTPAWRAHPGGTVLNLASFGEVVLVATSERRLVAYSDAGSRLWAMDLPEIGGSPPVAVSDDDAVLVDLSGRVLRFGVADGTVRWERAVGTDVNRVPGVGSGLVVVTDRSGTVTALDAGTGAERWTRSLDASAVAVAGGQVLVVVDQSVLALEPAAGRSVWTLHVDGRLTALTAFAGRALVATKEETLVVDDRGAVDARLPGYLAVDVTAAHLVGWTTDRLDVVGVDGAVVARWPTGSTTLVSNERPGLAAPQGVYLFAFSTTWTFQSWTSGG